MAVASAGLVGISGTSYQNNNQLSIHPIPVVAQIKTIAAAPIAIAAPIGIGKLGMFYENYV